MQITYPHTIDNKQGERLTFTSIEKGPDGERVIVEGNVDPGCGPIMHTHFHQDESLTVMKGKLGYQIQGEEPQYLNQGETVLFKRGVAHRFWNAGEEVMYIKGWISPPHTVVYFLSSLYAAQLKSNSPQPETFDGAYLMTRFSNEYDIPEIPGFVKKVIMPVTVLIGRLLGKYKHFEDAPEPVLV